VTRDDKYILPLEPMEDLPLEVSAFMRRITANKSNPDAPAIHKKLSDLFEREVNKKLFGFIEMQNECMRKIKKELAMQFYAVANTFNRNIIE
jgi:hypothetical protein